MAKNNSYDKALFRLVEILTKLSLNNHFTTKELAEEFGVSVRTIQKDIERLDAFPIFKNKDHKYMFIEGYTLNKSLLNKDEMMLVSLALSQFKDVSDFDKIRDNALKKMLSPRTFNPYFIKQDDIEDIDIESSLIEDLEKAIKEKKHVILESKRGDIEVEPYKIAAYDGIWYLVAKDEEDNRIKSFMLKRIKKIKILKEYHNESTENINIFLDNTHSAWFQDGISFPVVIKVYPKIAHFFKQRDFLQSQELIDTCEDGSLIIKFEISHYEDIDNIIKSWLPDIEVLEPVEYRDKITAELEEYLKRLKS